MIRHVLRQFAVQTLYQMEVGQMTKEEAIENIEWMVEGLKETTVPGKISEISKAGILVETGEGVILIKELKPEGKSKMDAYAWSNGAKISVGSYFE